MLSKHSSKSSLRVSLNSLKFLFESPLERSVRSTGGDGSSTPLLLSPHLRRADTCSVDSRTDDGNESKEDILTFESEDSVSVSESRDTISIDETKDTVSKGSSLRDIFDDKPAKDCISEADTVSVAGTCESRNEDAVILPLEPKECCICGFCSSSSLAHQTNSLTEAFLYLQHC